MRAASRLLSFWPIGHTWSRVSSLIYLAPGLTVLVDVAGCASVEPVAPSVQSIQAIKVKDPHQVVAGNNNIRLPAGIYQPDFSTKQGVYYRAPSNLLTSGIGLDTVEPGGIYLPNASDPDQRQAVWLDREEGHIFGLGSQPTKKVLRFKEQIAFERVSKSTADVAK
jgi:hypothetical protein